jgi:hypothetical protein
MAMDKYRMARRRVVMDPNQVAPDVDAHWHVVGVRCDKVVTP